MWTAKGLEKSLFLSRLGDLKSIGTNGGWINPPDQDGVIRTFNHYGRIEYTYKPGENGWYWMARRFAVPHGLWTERYVSAADRSNQFGMLGYQRDYVSGNSNECCHCGKDIAEKSPCVFYRGWRPKYRLAYFHTECFDNVIELAPTK